MHGPSRAVSLWLLAQAGLVAGCHVLYDDLPLGQCSEDADCVTLGGDGYRCDAQRVCVATATAAEPLGPELAACDLPGSASTAACEAGSCAVPLSSDCNCLTGAWDDPRALVIGVIAPRTFHTWSGEPLQIPYVPRWEASVNLALEDWRGELLGGLPRSGRPLALLQCNSNDELFRARRAFTHLTEVADAPAIITLTDNDTEAIQHLARRRGAAIVCSACFRAPAADTAQTIWRVAPALVDQAPAAAAHALRAATDPTRLDGGSTAPGTIVTLGQEYPGIDQFMAQLEQRLSAAGHSSVSIRTPDPRSVAVTQPQIAEAVISAQPRVIVVGMDSDFTTYYLRLIESGWPSAVPRPLYVLTYLNQELGLLSEVVGNDDDLRRRISGTGWHADADVTRAQQALDERFLARQQQHLDQTQYGYDAFYAVAYALSWADPRVALDSAGVMSGLSHLLAGPPVSVVPQAIKGALALLRAGQDVDLIGSSNRLDWDPLTHATHSDVGLWCLLRNADMTLELRTMAAPQSSSDTGELAQSSLCP